MDLLEGKTFPTILADPNWGYQNFGAKKHGAARGHYAGSRVSDMQRIPVARFARKNAILLLWATFPKLDEAIDVMRAWGFELITAVPWVKTVPKQGELAKGIGFWTQSSAELLLICRRGNAKAPKYGDEAKPDGLICGQQRVFYARRGAHSRKPLSLIEWIEAYLPGPLLELYARGSRPGWTCIGHEASTPAHLCEAGAVPLQEAQRLGMI